MLPHASLRWTAFASTAANSQSFIVVSLGHREWGQLHFGKVADEWSRRSHSSAERSNETEWYVTEERFAAIGLSAAARALYVVHVERGPRDRIISARLATNPERDLYASG